MKGKDQMKQLNLGDLFTKDEIEAASKLFFECKPGEFNRRVVEQIVQPAMLRINAATGQENDARYMGYLLEYVFSQASD
jgi:hypothetical protein